MARHAVPLTPAPANRDALGPLLGLQPVTPPQDIERDRMAGLALDRGNTMRAVALSDPPQGDDPAAAIAHSRAATLCRVDLVAHLLIAGAGQLELDEALDSVNVTLVNVASLRLLELVSDDPDAATALGLRPPRKSERPAVELWRAQLAGGARDVTPVEVRDRLLLPAVHDRRLVGVGRFERHDEDTDETLVRAIRRGLGEGLHRASLLAAWRFGRPS